MASGIADTESARLLACSLNGTAYGLNTGSYLALLTVAGSRTAAGTEVSGGSYGRILAPGGFNISGNTASNAQAINFAGMPATTTVAISTHDAVTAGNRRWWGDLTQSRTTNSGDTISFAAGAVTVAINAT